MLIVLSPAKRLNEAPHHQVSGATEPVFLAESGQLVERLRKFTIPKLQELMGISEELARLNHARYKEWEEAARKPAVFLFNGEAFRGLDAPSLAPDDLRFAQRHLRLLSGLYGVLRPLDNIAPYRLEMGTRLPVGKGIKDLYAFWGGQVTEELGRTLVKNKDEALVNLASTEYAKAIRPAGLPVRMVTPVFKERTAKGLRVVMMHAKHQRGTMARWIIRHRMLEPEGLKEYDVDGYRYQREGSTADEWLFVR
ncbi:MAG TPA: peroxide stress protein YaaA [Flavobacteriales bacterium]|mgnify:CR=1 FL=1|nr:peroxide stress protein YaaA [Flavobacteriales bacterium]